MRPLSRGYVEAKSNRPGDPPAINPRCVSDEAGRRAIVKTARTDDHRQLVMLQPPPAQSAASFLAAGSAIPSLG